MANPNPKPNMDIKNAPKPGPTSDIGKFRTSLNTLKPVTDNPFQTVQENVVLQLMHDEEVNGSAKKLLSELMKKSPHSAVHRYNLFLIWLKSMKAKDLKEISTMEEIFSIASQRYYTDVLTKIAAGEPPNKNELKQVEVLANVLEKLNNMKYGKKQVNVNASFKDIRAMYNFTPPNDNTGNKRNESSSGETERPSGT